MTRIDYDALCAEYHENLRRRLRSFRAGHAWLEEFVPDEDPVRGVLSLIEAAESAGLERLEVELGTESVARIERAKLLEMAELHGAATCRATPAGLLLEIVLADAPRPALPPAPAPAPAPRPTASTPAVRAAAVEEELGAAYHERALALARDARHGAELEALASDLDLAAEAHGWRLHALVIRDTPTLRALAHSGADSELARGVLECACRELVGMPILEAADHGALRVELALRAPDADPPTPGVVMPEHAGAALARLAVLLARLHASFVAHTGLTEIENRFWPEVGPRWAALDDRARLAAVNAILAELFPDREVVATSIDKHVRIALEIVPSIPAPRRRELLLRAEAELRRRLEPTLVVERRARRDLNRIRRL